MGCINSTDVVANSAVNALSDEELKTMKPTGYPFDKLFTPFRVVSIYDGDTITIAFDRPKHIQGVGNIICRGFRIKGYDAPEMKQAKNPPKESKMTQEEWEVVRRDNKQLAQTAKETLAGLLRDYIPYVYIEETQATSVKNYGRLFGDIYLFERGTKVFKRDNAKIRIGEYMTTNVLGCDAYSGGTKKTPVEIASLLH